MSKIIAKNKAELIKLKSKLNFQIFSILSVSGWVCSCLYFSKTGEPNHLWHGGASRTSWSIKSFSQNTQYIKPCECLKFQNLRLRFPGDWNKHRWYAWAQIVPWEKSVDNNGAKLARTWRHLRHFLQSNLPAIFSHWTAFTEFLAMTWHIVDFRMEPSLTIGGLVSQLCGKNWKEKVYVPRR